MLNGIAYVGYGFVGKACHEQFKHNVKAIIIDPKLTTTTVKDLPDYAPEIVFVSINAPTLQDGTVDDSVIHDVFADLVAIKYRGLVVLKSTLPPVQVAGLAKKYYELRYIYSPEFLREATWESDSLRPSQIILAGDYQDCDVMKDVYQKHSHVWQGVKYVIGVGYEEASMVKYTINCYLASKVTFMNQVYELLSDVCGTPGHQPQPEVWKYFTDMLGNDQRFGHSHLAVPGPDGQFGYGGSCFPKDVKAMNGFDKNERMTVLRETEIANTQHRLRGKVDKR